jgi:hypothetical protein
VISWYILHRFGKLCQEKSGNHVFVLESAFFTSLHHSQEKVKNAVPLFQRKEWGVGWTWEKVSMSRTPIFISMCFTAVQSNDMAPNCHYQRKGDQVGRIFACYAIVYLGYLF